VFASRVVTAVATGAFLSVAAVVATTAAGPERGTRAMGVMMSGMGLAVVAGVPLGSWIGQAIGWRGIFKVLPALAIIVAGIDWRLEAFVPLVLVGFCAGALTGTVLAGRLGDRRPLTTFLGIGISAAAVVALFLPLPNVAGAVIALIVLLGLTGMGVTAIATPLAVRFAQRDPALAAALAVSAFNVCIALATWLAGIALDPALVPSPQPPSALPSPGAWPRSPSPGAGST